MNYATRSDMVDRFGSDEIVKLEGMGGVIPGAIADASAEIDSYIGMVYTLPLTDTPAILVRVVCDIARYRLYDDIPTDEVRRRYEDAVRFLRDISAGRASLAVSTEDEDLVTSSAFVSNAPTMVFTNALLELI